MKTHFLYFVTSLKFPKSGCMLKSVYSLYVFEKQIQNYGGSIAENFVNEGARRKTNTTQLKVTKFIHY
jgi:hypothetical protein